MPVRFTEQEIAALDADRKSVTRSAWIRHRVLAAPTAPTAQPPRPVPAPELDQPHTPAETTHPHEPILADTSHGEATCQHTWVRAGGLFDRCTKCEERKAR